MAHLTLALFAFDPHQRQGKISSELSYVLVPQITTTPQVNAAAAVLGAAYDKCILRRGNPPDNQLITKLYLSALRQVQLELQRPNPEVVPLLLAAILLAAAEIVQHKRRDALCHLLGAFSMFNLEPAEHPKLDHEILIGPLAPRGPVEGLGPVQKFFHSLDYHISLFAWGRPLRFPHLPVTNEMLYPTSAEDLTSGHAALQQWSLHFMADALSPQWAEQTNFPPTLVAHQQYMVAWLKRWLRTYTLVFETPISSKKSLSQTANFMILKAQTLAVFIAVANVKPPTQVTYDAYAPQFEEILRCAEHALHPDELVGSVASQQPLPRYSSGPGIIHPLHFTVRKYRDSVGRRRAIHLLRQAGIEGPFNGEFEARFATRIVEIEEDRKPFKPVLSPEEVLLPSDIEDRKRVYFCWIEELLEDGSSTPNIPVGSRTQRCMKFVRRRGIAPTDRDPRVERQALQGENNMDRSEMWEIWAEMVEGP